MTSNTTEQQKNLIRIANFSDIELQAANVIPFEDYSSAAIVTRLREYADLPHVYVVADHNLPLVLEVLHKLKTIRSTCYPFALFVTDADRIDRENLDVDIITLESSSADEVLNSVNRYGETIHKFDKKKLNYSNSATLPESVDVLIVGAGITGLYAADKLREKHSFALVEKSDIAGGIWSHYANATSQVNTSEGAYRLIEKEARSNRDHSSTAEILADLHTIASNVSAHLFTATKAEKIEKIDGVYHTKVLRDGTVSTITSKGLILAINDRVGHPRKIEWPEQQTFAGEIISGNSDESADIDWQGKKVVVVGMGAFAIENVRTALENGASHVSVVCRRHGTVCPKIIDYLNFATPYDDKFQHERKSNIRNMMLWKKLYDQSKATQPECWMAKIKHEGHTISVSDIWFIAHHLKKLTSYSGSISAMYENGVIVNNGEKVDADIVVNCVGFHRNAPLVKELCDYDKMYNNNYIDKDLMYLADAYIDDDVFNSFFGSSVLEMTKFYMKIYLDFFDSNEFETMINSKGIEKIDIEDRRWSHYIAGADALIENYPHYYDFAKSQIEERSANFLEAHDLETYIAANRREWFATHELLNGAPLKEADCLPYVFEKLLEKKLG